MSLTLEDSPAFLDSGHAELARELAQNIRDPQQILTDHGFDGPNDPRWVALAQSPNFARMILEAQREWNAADSTRKRIQYKALAQIEMLLVVMHKLAFDPQTPAALRIEATRFIERCAGIGAAKVGASGNDEGAGGVNIQIVIGAKTISKTVPNRQTPILEGESEEA